MTASDFQMNSKLKQGLGFHIMNYRAQLMGGRLEIDSPKGGGTCVSCYLPNHAVQIKRNRKKTARTAAIPAKITESTSRINLNFLHLTHPPSGELLIEDDARG